MAQQLNVKAPPAATLDERYITYEEFLGEEYDGVHAEWVDGKVIPMSAVSDAHQSLKVYIAHILQTFVEALDLGEVRDEPYQMKTGPDLPGRSPDVLFVAKKNIHRLKANHLEGPADLVVEVISPGTATIDRGPKFHEYQEGGVREYWILDPHAKKADFYALDRNRRYKPIPIDSDGVFRSTVLKGIWIEVGWLWLRPHPPATRLLKEWKLL